MLCVYDFTRGAADSFGIGVHVTTMIDFDRSVFFGETPTEWLQAHLYEPGVVHWWDVAFTLVYTSYFIVPFAVAGVLWARDRARLPALHQAPRHPRARRPRDLHRLPGGAALDGRRKKACSSGVHRTTAKGWEVLDVGTAGALLPRPGRRQPGRRRALAALGLRRPRRDLPLEPGPPGSGGRCWPLYPLAMGLTLIATGEHYFFDVALGWLYAGAVMAGWGWWERRRSRRRARAALSGVDRLDGERVDPAGLGEPQRDQVAQHQRREQPRRAGLALGLHPHHLGARGGDRLGGQLEAARARAGAGRRPRA